MTKLVDSLRASENNMNGTDSGYFPVVHQSIETVRDRGITETLTFTDFIDKWFRSSLKQRFYSTEEGHRTNIY